MRRRSASVASLLVALAAAPSGGADPATRPAVTDAEFDAVLDTAASLDPPARQRALAAVAGRFQDVDVCTVPGRNRWSFRSLNRRGRKFDAVRFTVPPGRNTRLFWAFTVPGLTEWYIEPVSGDHAELFKDYTRSTEKYDVPQPLYKHLILQRSAERLDAGAEYVLWFKLDTDKPVLFAGSLVLVDRDGNESDRRIERAVGLRRTDDDREP